MLLLCRIATPLFFRFFDIGNFYISSSYVGIKKKKKARSI